MNAQDPQLPIGIRIGSSDDLLRSFDRRELDAVLARQHVGRSDGEVVAEEKFGWFGTTSWQHRADEPLPLATIPEPCGVRASAVQLLDAAAVPWTEIFVGGGVAAVSAAVMVGLGVAALAPVCCLLARSTSAPNWGFPSWGGCQFCSTPGSRTDGRATRLPPCLLPSGARREANQHSSAIGGEF